ncbi:MAG TPA: S46 family peptidase, partial [bacterium]
MIKKNFSLVLLFMLIMFALAQADEGMWTLDALKQLPWDQMKAKGLQLSPEDIYNPKGVGLSDAIIQIGGGTGSFVSPNGLIVTNHHVAYGAIQRQSSAEQDFIRNGFLAETMDKEIPAKGYTGRICIGFEEVTKSILKGITDKMSYNERNDLIEKNTQEIVKQAEKEDYIQANVVDMLSGTKYYLFSYYEIKDVRLVYAPPRSVGEYGGDIDNWMWPRHTGDFSFMRAYVGPDGKPAEFSDKNVPYKPKNYLKISLDGVKENDFTMIMGYPGNTLRYRDSYSVDVWQNEQYPAQIEASETSIKALEELAGEDRELQIKYAAQIKGLNNNLKYTQGMMEGLKRTRLLEKKRKQEAEFTKFLKQNPELDKKYGHVLPEIAKVYADLWTYNKKQITLGNILGSSQLLGGANYIQRWSIEKQKNEKDREQGFSDRQVERTKKRVASQRDLLDIPADKKLLAIVIDKAADLPEGQKIAAIENIVGNKTGTERKKAAKKFVEEMFAR